MQALPFDVLQQLRIHTYYYECTAIILLYVHFALIFLNCGFLHVCSFGLRVLFGNVTYTVCECQSRSKVDGVNYYAVEVCVVIITYSAVVKWGVYYLEGVVT